MRRKELKKAIRDFSQKTNFYKLGLIRKYLITLEKEKQKAKQSIPNIYCPRCGSKNIDIEYSDNDYDDSRWLYCNSCENEFDDVIGYFEAIDEYESLSYSDVIKIELYIFKPDTNTLKWQEFCEEEILKKIGEYKNNE